MKPYNKLFISTLTSVFAMAFLLPQKAWEQTDNISIYPQNYFRNPLSISISLAGNFGECRPSHFHSGLDIKTNQRENLPVYAAAEGYISRISMNKGGFGHALYINHPNGFTTVYAHLNDFVKPVQQYLRKMQYEKESWTIDLQLMPGQFPVKKGDLIAWSGNTGGSQAPHLHFEIRDTQTEHPLNPLLFGLPVLDKTPPKPEKIALYDMNQNFYDQQADFFNLIKKGNYFTVAKDTVLTKTNRLGIGIKVSDFMDGSQNTLNFFTAEWYLDEVPQGSIALDDIGYDETRYLHAYIDYKTRKQTGEWFQLLLKLPGNKLSHIYPFLNEERGIIGFEDTFSHRVRIVLKDALENKTEIVFYVKSDLSVKASGCEKSFQVNTFNNFEHPNLRFSLDESALYDNVCFRFQARKDEKSFSDRYEILSVLMPSHTYFNLQIKPNKPVAFNLRDKIVIQYSDGKIINGRAAEFKNGWYSASVRSFGTYWLVADTAAPVIKSMQPQNALLAHAKQIRFQIKENLTSVKEFRAELNGKWLCFEPRGDYFFYEFDEHCPKGKHRLEIIATDENNNTSRFIYNFTR